MKGILEVSGDKEARCFADPLEATVDGQPVLIDRFSLPEGITIGDEVVVEDTPCGTEDQTGRFIHRVVSRKPIGGRLPTACPEPCRAFSLTG
ncbi:MAG: hypothetical protein A3J62_01835 [Candidatus Buchananbacteria bacterium RIFCSPHIGHO2_02_FULL_38_8]|uniref:Uncharacterized protein n=1 Tax=Candidatus Buchananbacteria bacterium RIFCSPHIGHO2_02_FULL_38_8 TaxID=1797538 RepID=A0A1G1Y491_9BACT|nr:hypothetical protein [uncultured bacterium]OGY47145.1 MAG: hypothetical protein A3J62_01835 [Candidatus Buchananbacteria bacterium RIFCSPHIGHO2_02_FULL_38_8]